MEKPDSYDLFAETYNRWMAQDFCRRALPVIERLFLPRLPARRQSLRSDVPYGGTPQVLDLCCGSGQIANALSHRGLHVFGLDSSAQMVCLARQNAPAAEFARMDARFFRLPCVFSGALSTFNSLAHIADLAELQRVFRNVRAALLPGSPFLFDLSMEEAYRHKWRGRFMLAGENHACIVRPSYDPARRLGRNEITVFRAPASGKAASGCAQLNFVIEQKCYAESELCRALGASGFSDLKKYDAEYDLGIPNEWGRSFFLAR